MTVEDILSKLSKKTRERAMLAMESTLERMPLPSQGLTKATGGGFGYGRITGIWGPKSSAKSSLILEAIGHEQAKGKTALWVDAEKSFDRDWAESLGVDTSQLIVSNAKSFEQVTDVMIEAIQAGVDIAVIDSIGVLIPMSFLEKDSDELKGLDGTKQIGSTARDLGNMLKMINYVNDKCAVIVISQVRNKFLQHGAMHTHMGGFSLDHNASTIIKVSASSREDDQIKGSVHSGNKIFQQPVGRKVNWQIDKNKIGQTNITGEYDFYYAGDEVGVDTVGEVVDLAERHGIIVKGGAWYTYGDVKVQGRMRMVNHLREVISDYDDIVEKLKETE